MGTHTIHRHSIEITTDIPEDNALHDNVAAWEEKLRRTAELVPANALRLLVGGQIVIAHTNPDRGGATRIRNSLPRSSIQMIRISHAAFGQDWNQGPYCFTFLHEMGHLMDKWRIDRGVRPTWTCMRHLRRDIPLSCWAILRRPHEGATSMPSEHFADTFADFCFTVRGGQPRFNQMEQSATCSNSGPQGQVCSDWTTATAPGNRAPRRALSARGLTPSSILSDVQAQIHERFVGYWYSLLSLSEYWTSGENPGSSDERIDEARAWASEAAPDPGTAGDEQASAARWRDVRGGGASPRERPHRPIRPEGSFRTA